MLLRVSALLCVGVCACGGSLPLPRQVVPPDEAYLNVPYPPPAALTELVPEQPSSAAVWVDGGWVWRGSYYVWDRGGWVTPAPGASFAPWRLRYLKNGQAQFARSTWVDVKGERIRGPRVLLPAATPPNEVTAEFQTGR